MKRIALWAAFLSLTFATIGTDFASRQFVKITFGPVYLLEVLLVIFVVFALLADPHISWKSYIQALWPVFLFFLWGSVLLVVDVSRNYAGLTPYLWQRIAQHAILFVYPLAWMSVGVWAFDHFNSRWIHWLIVAMVVFGATIHNISLGPIIVIPAMLYLVRSQLTNVSILQWMYAGLALLLGLIAFYPFWIMYTTSMQRTSLLLLLVLLLGVPWFCCPPRNISIPLKSIALSLALFLTGIVAVSVRSARTSDLPNAAQSNLPSVHPQNLSPRLRSVPPTNVPKPPSVSHPAPSSLPKATTSNLPSLAQPSLPNAPPQNLPSKLPPVPPTNVPKPAGVSHPAPSSVSKATTPNLPSLAQPSVTSVPSHSNLPDLASIRSRVLSKSGLLRSAIISLGLKSLQHGEDLPDWQNPKHFQFRTRKFMWQMAFADWQHNRLFGIGFIPEVPSYVRPGFINKGGFVDYGDPPVSGPHNSYLSVLARMGLVGLALLMVLAWQSFLKVRSITHGGAVGFADLFLIFVPLDGAVHAMFNVGFESPHKCMIMWLFMGFLFARGTKLQDANHPHPHRL